MATLLLSAVGTLVGGPLGGAVGALVGRQVDSAILGDRREGPRLRELAATASSYGEPLPRHFGRMRVAGSIVWATDLIEHASTDGGKGRPSVTTYTYTASFAVVVASRPIVGIGRIWADGNLLRGQAGDLKAGGTMRVHTGHGDQEPDPLIATIEGSSESPAYRGLAYVVFEDLELGDFFNRIPALTFEVIADEGEVGLAEIAGELLDDADAAVALEGVTGFSCEGPLADTLALLDPFFPITCDAGGERLTIARERLQPMPAALPAPTIAVEDGEFGAASGYLRRRSPLSSSPPEILRYYDRDRDYQPGMQRAPGRPAPGQPRTVQLPAALDATQARALAERAARNSYWRRETLAWRCAQLDPDVAPGTIVTAPGQPGRWRVEEWEWRDSGVELSLSRVVPQEAATPSAGPVDPGRVNPPPDLQVPATALIAFELPWDGAGSPDTARIFAAASASNAAWSGAALYADDGSGELAPLGPSGRTRSILGTAQDALVPASPLLLDRASTVTVTLIDPAMELRDASLRQLAGGANRALLGDELLQFGRAVPLGEGQWRLEQLLRGRGGTEAAVSGHAAGEPFVLLDGRAIALDPAIVGTAEASMIVAVGRGDDEPVASAIALRGAALRPLSPVHPRVSELDGGALALGWTRRARGAWLWRDGVDAPLVEQTEAYVITFGPMDAPLAVWSVAEPHLVVSGSLAADLAAQLPGGTFAVRQQGTHALSHPLHLATLN